MYDGLVEGDENDALTPTVQLPRLGNSQSLPTLTGGKATPGINPDEFATIRFPSLPKKQLQSSGQDFLSRSMSSGIDGACLPGFNLGSPVR